MKDGGTDFSPNLGTFCRDRPPTQKSSGNVMRIKYYTNSNRPNLGFKAKISIATCGGTIHVNSKAYTRIHSPDYPAKYPANVECLWTIIGPDGHFLNIGFEDLQLPFSQNCSTTDHLDLLVPNATRNGCKFF